MDENEAIDYLASELSWDDEPALSVLEQERLLTSALSDGEYSVNLLDAAIYQGYQWKLAKAVEYNEGDEKVIWDHLVERVAFWRLKVALSNGGGVYAGGISVSDRDARIENPDRVRSAFTVGTGQTFSNKISNWS